MSGERIELGNQQASAQPIQGDSFDRIVSETTQLFQILEDETFTQGNEFVTKSRVIDETLLLWRLQALKQSIEKSLEVLNKRHNEINYQKSLPITASLEEKKAERDRRAQVSVLSDQIGELKRYLKACHLAIKQREASLKKLGSISEEDWDRVRVTPESRRAYAVWYQHEKKGIPFRLYQEEVLEPVAQKKRPLSIAGRVLMALAVVALAVIIALIVAMPALLPATPLILGLAFGLPALTGVVGGALLYKGWDPEGREWSQEERKLHFGEWKERHVQQIAAEEARFRESVKGFSETFSSSTAIDNAGSSTARLGGLSPSSGASKPLPLGVPGEGPAAGVLSKQDPAVSGVTALDTPAQDGAPSQGQGEGNEGHDCPLKP